MASVNMPVRGVGAVVNGWSVLRLSDRAAVLAMGQRQITVAISEMIGIQGGTFTMGSTRWTDTQPIRQVTLTEYAIGKYPVTNAEWLGYLQVAGKTVPDLVSNPDMTNHPVVNVSWNDAMNYCTFLMEITGRRFGLPTEAQWEFAARGTEGRTYPWGNESYEGRVNFNSGGTTRVNNFPTGATPSGIFDMAGNVWEWTMDCYADGYSAKDLTDPKGPGSGTYKVLRGGSWCSSFSDELMAAYRCNVIPEYQDLDIGLRLAEDLR